MTRWYGDKKCPSEPMDARREGYEQQYITEAEAAQTGAAPDDRGTA